MGFPSLLAAAQLLVALPSDGTPVRCGLPLPADAVRDGLSLSGRGALQWRPLPVDAPAGRCVWVELAIVAPRGTARIVRGGAGPCPDGRGPAYVRTTEVVEHAWGTERRSRWAWCDGSVDERVRCEFRSAVERDGERYEAGEALTRDSEGLWRRARALLALGRDEVATMGLLPPAGGGGATARAARRQLAAAVDRLVELPGARGAGDFARSGGVVTNLEFDTTLALLRVAFGCGSERAFRLALRSAAHLRDRDFDAATGLPFPHGPGHRTGVPEAGHAWLQGLLWVGLVSADDEHIVAARQLGLAIASARPSGAGAAERLRDFAWPLRELEALLAIAPEPGLAAAADAIARAVAQRFDEAAGTFRFGEGEVGGGVYLERGWLTGGLLVPALRAHLARRPDAVLAERVRRAEQALLERIGTGGPGLPTHWRISGGRAFAEHRERGTAKAAFLLDAAPPRDLVRLLRRASVRRAIDEVPHPDDPDLPTVFTLVARCEWPWR